MSFLPESGRIKLTAALLATGVSLVLALALAALYPAVPIAGPAWMRAAALHTGFSVLILGVAWTRGELPTLFAIKCWQPFAPAVLIAFGAVALASSTRFFSHGVSGAIGYPLLWIVWVPVVEELVFRAGIQNALGLLAGPIWSVWFGALVFGLAHAQPTIGRLMSGEVGVPLGPLLLGLTAGVLFAKTNQILPSIALHAACNATPLIFAAIDERWLQWLGFLYQ